MNLAELRKKAKKAKNSDEGRVVTPYYDLQVSNEPPAEAEVLIEPVQEIGCSSDFVEAEPEVAEREVILPQAIRTSQRAFDPVAMLLAGRQSALVEEAAFADAATAVETSLEEFQEFLCFRVSTETYAINIMSIKEIIKPREVTEVPRAPAFVSGVLSLRGIIIPVFNMRLRLGLQGVEKPGAKERIVVLKKSDAFFGILVDEVVQVVRIASVSIEKPPAVLDGIDRDFVSGIGRFETDMLILLNIDKILDLTLV